MSYTIVHRTPLDVSRCRAEGLSPLPLAQGLFKTGAAKALLESPILYAPGPFDRLVGSWNARVPPGAQLEMQARILNSAGWSPWFSLGREEGGRFSSPPKQENAFGFVDIDTLRVSSAAIALRYRFLIHAAPKSPVILSLAAATVSDGGAAAARPFHAGPWVRELKARPRSQMEQQSKYRRDICSPTALSMLLDYWGRRRTTAAVARAVRDETTGDFGDWTFNTAYAGSPGLAGYAAYLPSLTALQNEIARGRPVVASVTFGAGELSGAPIARTNGHLMLVVGFTRSGDVIVLDPAAKTRAGVRRVYKRGEFRRVWLLNKRGLAYLIGPLQGQTLAVGVPAADLLAAPAKADSMPWDDGKRHSQLLYGESATLLRSSGAWARVRAEEEPHFSAGRWRGYPGWVRVRDLLFSPGLAPNAVVRSRRARLDAESGGAALSAGTRLFVMSEDDGRARVLLPDSRTGEIASSDLWPLSAQSPAARRQKILEAAAQFLGLGYVWGGRSAVQKDPSRGVDCSGLSGLAYRAAGLEIPRDAADQKRASRAIPGAQMKPGDLIFLSDERGGARVTHVMIYAGGGSFIESRKTAGAVRGDFRKRFGVSLRGLKSGQKVKDRALSPPQWRRVYFGSYF